MLPQYLLDTDVSSYVIKYQPPSVARKFTMLLLSQLSISAITQAELHYGLQKLSDTHVLHDKVHDYLNRMSVLDWSANATLFYAKIRHDLEQQGQKIGDMDMMIAAHALATNRILVTNNIAHFEKVKIIYPELDIENWI